MFKKDLLKKYLLVILVILTCKNLHGQSVDDATVFHIQSAHTSFPDTGREKGHLYNKVLYTAAGHYHDSTVLIIVPPHLDAKKKVDLIFWFHGWMNRVDSAAVRYQLTTQFLQSHRNAVLVSAETAKDAPDSYGGKLENKDEFKLLSGEVLAALKTKSKIPAKCTVGNVMLAGHSGAYRVMAFIVQNGGVEIKEVILFDALYAQTDKFINWIKENSRHRFIDLYTDHGGTDEESRNMIKLLDSEQINYQQAEEKDVTPEFLVKNRIVFIHSLREHNDIINQPDNFKLFLENTPVLKPY